MPETVQTLHHGDAPTAGGIGTSKALEVASRGIRTPRDITNFAIAHSIDVLQERIGPKAANASLRGVTVGLRAVEIGHRVGQHHEVASIAAIEQDDETLRREEAELTARLEAIRERRSR